MIRFKLNKNLDELATGENYSEVVFKLLEWAESQGQLQFMDTGYVTAEHLVNSRTQYDVEIIAPVRSDPSWQARTNPDFAADQFHIDWAKQVATCPMGQQRGAMRFGEIGQKGCDR
ncbi:hypothetical protein U1Q18_052012 [Sarracenia purpurea var. burkii]